MKVFLVGMPGSGKSTLGRPLAQGLGLRFVDLDAAIEKEEGMSIVALFNARGEAYFRKKESALLISFCDAKKDLVMATGGGAPCWFDNMKRINDAGYSVFLDVPTPALLSRLRLPRHIALPFLSKDHIREPLSLDRIEALRRQRLPFYRRAHYTFSGSLITAEAIIEKINAEPPTRLK